MVLGWQEESQPTTQSSGPRLSVGIGGLLKKLCLWQNTCVCAPKKNDSQTTQWASKAWCGTTQHATIRAACSKATDQRMSLQPPKARWCHNKVVSPWFAKPPQPRVCLDFPRDRHINERYKKARQTRWQHRSDAVISQSNTMTLCSPFLWQHP